MSRNSRNLHSADVRLPTLESGVLSYKAQFELLFLQEMKSSLERLDYDPNSDTYLINPLASIRGTDGDDTLTGTSGSDSIYGGDGNDTLSGLGGNDLFFGGDGGDTIYGGSGDDTLWGDGFSGSATDDFDVLFAGDGNDRIESSASNATIYGGSGNDQITARGLFVDAENGNDLVNFVGAHTSTIIGGTGYDRVTLRANGLAYEHVSGFEVIEVVGGASGFQTIYLVDSNLQPGSSIEVTGYSNYGAIDGSAVTVGSLNVSVGYVTVVYGGQQSDTISSVLFGGGRPIGEGDPVSFYGNAGNDTLAGNIGDDLFEGGTGDDYIDGASGLDVALFSGELSDYIVTESTYATYIVEDTRGLDGTDTLIDINVLRFSDQDLSLVIQGVSITGDESSETLEGGQFSDLIDGKGGSDELIGNGGNDSIVGGAGNDTLTGNLGSDFLIGGSQDDFLHAGDGDDSVDGGTGNDTIIGGDGRGDDTYVGGAGIDTVIYSSALDFSLTVNLSTGDASGSGIGLDRISGIENVVGGAMSDIITGSAAANRLDGGGGNDTLRGGAGNDTYITKGGDTITEKANQGTDTVQSSVSFTLGANLENLVLTGSSGINGTGNTLNNRITGNSGANTLNGGSGSDTLLGGAEHDTYIVNGGDTVTENANQGTDTVQSSVTFTLGSNVEKLTLTGSSSIHGTGNTLANTIMGNGANNTLNGSTGIDTLTGGSGADTFIFNTALGASNVDRITDFNVAADTIRLENAVFTGLAGGTLAATAFVRNTSGNAADASDRIIYETDTGRLYFDRDGTGAAAKVHFATIGTNLAVTHADFFVF
jgi:Ca2+-binding RTX toxin-like protein